MSFKYLARVCVFGLLVGGCVAPSAPAGPTMSAVSSPAATSDGGLTQPIAAEVRTARRWHTRPDALQAEPVTVIADFTADPRAGEPIVRSDVGPEQRMDVSADGTRFRATATLPLAGSATGERTAEVFVRLESGERVSVGRTTFLVSAPEYVVWTLDFEGDDAGDTGLANTAAIADRFQIPMTLMWNPRVWTTSQVSAVRADAMLAWTKTRAARGDEVALHVHMWTDFVRAAGVTPRTTPSWAGRADGYDVPLTAFGETETAALLDLSLRLMAERGLPRPVTFRAGGQFANAANLRALAAAGFIADCSGVPAGTFGRLRFPWTLPTDAQPYRPSAGDANTVGDLPILEAPTIGGNTFGHNATSIAPIARANLSFLAPPGAVAATRRAITAVSHPSTINGVERAAIEALFAAFEPLRYDRDAGPLRFVTLAQLAKAYGS